MTEHEEILKSIVFATGLPASEQEAWKAYVTFDIAMAAMNIAAAKARESVLVTVAKTLAGYDK